MAAQGALKRAENAANGAGKPRVGRPRKARVFDYSKYRQTLNDPNDFAAYLSGYPDETGLCAYIYRLHPKIDLSVVGSSVTNIWETRDPAEMTANFIESKFGRGRYMLKLNDANRPKGQADLLRIFFKLDDSVVPPVYDIRTLVLNHAENIDEVNRQIALGVLTRDLSGNPRIRTAADGPANANGAPVVAAPAGPPSNELLSREMIGQVLLKMIDKSGTQPSPMESLKQAIEVANMLRPAENVEAVVERVLSRMLPAPGGSGDGLDVFDVYSKVDGLLTKFRGDGNGAVAAAVDKGPGSWVPHLPGIISQIRAAIPELSAALRDFRTNNLAAGAVAVNGNGHTPQPAPVPQRAMTMDQKIEEIFRIGFEKMSAGVSGFDFATFIYLHHPGGRQAFDFLDGAGGAAGLMALIAMNPATAPLIAEAEKRAQIESFVSDFFSFDPSAFAAPESVAAAGA